MNHMTTNNISYEKMIMSSKLSTVLMFARLLEEEKELPQQDEPINDSEAPTITAFLK